MTETIAHIRIDNMCGQYQVVLYVSSNGNTKLLANRKTYSSAVIALRQHAKKMGLIIYNENNPANLFARGIPNDAI